jgi:hypothetical protein
VPLDVNAFKTYVAARLQDFFRPGTPWHRGLWTTGLVLSLRETAEAAEAVQAGVLSRAALRDLAETVKRLAGRDPGTGPASQQKLLQDCLQSELRSGGVDHRLLCQITQDVETHYLDRWSTVLTDSGSLPGPERTARSIASHLLDAGLSPDFLCSWWTRAVRKKGEALPSLVASAHDLVCEAPRKFTVLVAFEGFPEGKSGVPPSWLAPPAVSEWLRSNGFNVAGIRQNGGTLLTVCARDAWSAVDVAVERVDRFSTRVAVGTNSQLKPIPWAWVAGENRKFHFRQRPRSVQVHALYREDQLYTEVDTKVGRARVDAAIELLAPLASSSSGVAVAGGWAAIETLLSGPGDSDRGIAGDRLAALVACSFPRAELTPLSYKAEKGGGDIGRRLSSCTSNRDRARLMAQLIDEGESLPLTNASDIAALTRVRKLLAHPHGVLRDIENHIRSTFRRLYRQRNLVLHWGTTDAVALRASLRTTAHLVGAGMDRITHASFVDGVEPLELAARARWRLDTVGTRGTSCVDLLG